MIKNIVFDMGKVLVGYDGMRVCEHFLQDPSDQQQVHTAVFVSPEWVQLDMGVIPEEQALAQMCSWLPERLRQPAALCMENWHRYCMWPIEGAGDVVREYKEKGYGIYLCSNASLRLLDCYRQVIPAIDCFDGVLFSAEVKCMKPQKEMYLHLFERFGLRPEECYFIDDQPLNIEGARNCGMDGFCHRDGSAATLKKALEKALGSF